MTMRLLKLLGVLILAAVAGLIGYAYFGDMNPTRNEVRQPIEIPADAAPATDAPAADIGTDTGSDDTDSEDMGSETEGG